MRRVLSVVEGVAAALLFAHTNGIVHFDLKPSNVFLTDDGQVKVIDFGIARAIRRPEQREANDTVFDPGTLRAMSPSYASPEMIDGMQPDRRDDIFSLAYAREPLPNAVNDARAIGSALRAHGFEVVVVEDAGSETMRSAGCRLRQAAGGGRLGFVLNGYPRPSGGSADSAGARAAPANQPWKSALLRGNSDRFPVLSSA